MNKLIFTIDLDAFFASAEELRNPEVKGKPMIVGNEINGRGIATTANYAAREYGISSGMPLFKVKELCKDIIVIPVDHEYYQNKANEVFKIVLSFTDKVEFASIDECHADMTKLAIKKKPLQIARELSKVILDKTGLSVSIGISTNILLSKMASNIDKPNGITTLYQHEIPTKLWPMPVSDLYTVGKSTTAKLLEHNIKTIGDLSKVRDDSEKFYTLKKLMGINFEKAIDKANGIYRDEIQTEEQLLKSVSKEETFGNSLRDIESIKSAARNIYEYTLYRAKRRKQMPSTITVALKRDKSFNKFSKSKVIDKTLDTNQLWFVVDNMIDDLFKEGMSIKQVSISLSGLKPIEKVYKQLSIDESNDGPVDHVQDLVEISNQLNTSEAFKGSTMKDNRKFEKKEPLDNDTVKLKSW